jgi:uncharacterized protein YdbL (DUF1318 family)
MVNFPESTVQKATDDYVKDLYKAKEKSRGTDQSVKKTPPKPMPDSGPGAGGPGTGDTDPAKPDTGAPTSWLDRFDLVSSAMAAEADVVFSTSTPKATDLQAKMAAKLNDVESQKQAGNIGEGGDGMLVVKAKQPLLVKKLEALVKEQNGFREELYDEIRSANKMPKSRLADIKKSFARSFQKHSPSGTWIQDAAGSWSQK